MPSNPTFDECWTQAALAFKFPNAVNLFGSSNTPNVADMLDALTTGVDGAYTPRALEAAKAMARNVAAAVAPEALRALWSPFLDEMIRAAAITGLEDTSDAGKLRAIRQYMVDNSKTINSRGMTLPTSLTAGGSNVGTGSIYRVVVDKDGNPLECTGAEAKQAKVFRDAHTGGARKYAEAFLFTGAPASPYGNLRWEGSGPRLARKVLAAHPLTGRIILNPSFDTNDASADNSTPGSTTAITNWTIGSSASNFALRSAAGYTFGSYPGAPSTQYGVEFLGNDSLTQVIADVNPGARFGRGPYFIAIRYKRKSSCDGTLTLALGGSSVAVALTSATNDQWATAYIALDENAYFENFNASGLALSITLASRTTGSVVVDSLIVCEMVNVDGTYYLPVSGATAFLKGDLFTWTDQDGGTRGIFSFLLWLAYGPDGWLPTDNAGTETISDPS